MLNYKKLEDILKQKGITPYRLAKEIGISNVVFSEWKRGKSQPKLDKLIKITEYLGITIDDLIDRKDL